MSQSVTPEGALKGQNLIFSDDPMANLVALTDSLTESITDPALKKKICDLIDNEHLEVPVLSLVKSQLANISDKSHLPDILFALQSFSKDTRAEAAPLLVSYYHGISFDHTRTQMYYPFMRIPADKRVRVLRHTVPLIQNIQDGPTRSSILDAVDSFLAKHGEEHVKETASLIDPSTDGDKIVNIFCALSFIDTTIMPDLIEYAKPLISECNDGPKCYQILLAVDDTPEKLRKTVVQNVTDRVQREEDPMKIRDIFSQEIAKIPQ